MASVTIKPLILSGGVGSRLWPHSREAYPKQFLPLLGERTLFQETADRIGGMAEPRFDIRSPLVVCNEQHRFLVAEQLRQVGYEDADILLEPSGRNTAPALTIAALHVRERLGEECILAVMPADHHIADVEGFRAGLARALGVAGRGLIGTFGIVPDRPETGYGYIRKGRALEDGAVFDLEAFVEKPDAETASRYLSSGDYLWNSGLFVLRASVWLERIGLYRPDILEACSAAYEKSCRDGNFIRVDRTGFLRCPSDSIDYAVMEKLNGTGQAAVIPLDVGWCDLGSWASLSEVKPRDDNGNVVEGDVYARDTSDSLLYSDGRFLAAIGVHDLLVVDTADAVLVAHKSKAQDIKQIAEHLKAANRTEHKVHRRVHRPWGTYESIDTGQRYQVKRITVTPGSALSLQMHHHRAEHWIVVRGTARVVRGEESFLLTENQSTYIPIGVHHRLENPGTIPLEIIEVQSGSYLGEDDIVRFQDQYHRTEER
ncbi:mannose-1-phosphate guanylyltransferase/mannose-6-phosphate isomerase [Methylococcus sp. ANG]|uniref:mannose-1-phosphate guanylyltransferase/mannose-6-phosphate isomerase n=1 Tax=Methylococcus sp. ANG TaxID=3231903 RepID=UPI003458CF0F